MPSAAITVPTTSNQTGATGECAGIASKTTEVTHLRQDVGASKLTEATHLRQDAEIASMITTTEGEEGPPPQSPPQRTPSFMFVMIAAP